ncbi:MAG: YciI family protein [Gemmatimonadaceae bacterium]
MEEHPGKHDPLRALGRGIDPPDALEHRVRRTLTARGLLRRRPSSVLRRVAAAAAAVALFAAGYLTGESGRDDLAEPDGAGRYALFLYEDSAFDTSRPEMELVAEYSAWAAALRERGRLETGEQLASAEILLERQADSIVVGERGPAAEAGALTGLFVIRAASESEALSIARTCPHLKYGGRIAVRAIVETG